MPGTQNHVIWNERFVGTAATDACPSIIADTLGMMGSKMTIERNSEIFAEEEQAEYLYLLLSGVVRTCKFLKDGRRQIGAFHFAGDLFGFEPSDAHGFSAEAVTPCRVVVVRRSAVMDAAARDPELSSALWLHASRELQRLNEHMVLLGRKSAAERVIAFLRATGVRLHSRAVVEIPMSRQDIADHLGLTIETVSRTMTQLRESGVISLGGSRRIRVEPEKLAA